MAKKKTKAGGGVKAGEVIRGQLGGSVSVGEKNCGVALILPRAALCLAEADDLLTDARLDVKLQAVDSEEEEGQITMWADITPDEKTIEAQADCSGFAVRKEKLRARLVFSATQEDVVERLLNLRGCDVRVCLARVGDSDEDAGDE